GRHRRGLPRPADLELVMPTYTFRNNETLEEVTEVCSISEMETKESEGWTVLPAAPFIGDAIRQGMKKPSEGFRDVLRTIKRKHKGGRRVDNTRGVNTW